MALIELNVEKPALKRTEIAENAADEAEMRTVDIDDSETTQTDAMTDMDATAEADENAEESKSGGRIRRTARRAAMVGAMTGAAVAARKIRARRKGAGTQTEVDEDWQTANN